MTAAIPLILLLILLSRTGPSGPGTAPVPATGAVPQRNTGGGGGPAWVRARRQLLSSIGVPPQYHDPIVAHWARETGFGRFEWNWNPGNIRGIGWSGPRVWLRGRDGLLDYRAYPDAASGARDYWRLIRTPRYRRAFARLQAGDPVGWYDALLRAGYSAHSPAAVDEFRRILERVRGIQ